MCKHNYNFGHRVKINATGTSICENCGCDNSELIDNSTLIFRGHNNGLAMFDLEKPFHCSGCNELVNGYAEYCESLQITEFVKREVTSRDK